ncbi:Ras-related protein Rab-21 [Durusdinium trenchii]|uniref:Ras-related protein Rab-21 n=1 Tax=Durusdinium trenchii TaxID=1381693 RepID=A0ABP0IEV9_9DINO
MSQKHFGPFKIVILGEGRVGKTSLLRRYVSQSFDSDEASTQSAAYLDKVLQLRGTQVQLSLWDTAGQERFHALAPIYYRDADGALLVYDVTEPESFRRVAKWVEELQVAGPQCALAIVGNKCDLQSQARVPKADAESYARSINARHSVASAKLGHGVEETFGALVEDVLTSKATRSGAGGGRRTRGTIVVAEDEPAQRKGCCGGN